MSDVARAATLVAFPVLAAAGGSVVAAVRRPGPRLVAGVQHFAAGVVIAALVGEVMPDLRNEGQLAWAVGGFAVGVALMLALGALGRRLEGDNERGSGEHGSGDGPAAATEPVSGQHVDGEGSAVDTRAGSTAVRRAALAALPLGLLTTVAIDLLMDGLLVGLGVTLSAQTGIILTVALTLEILFLALAVSGELMDDGVPPRRAATISAGLGLLTAVGAIGGVLLLGAASPQVLAAGLAFGAAALLYLAVEELLVEAHEQSETWVMSALFFAGFLAIYILGELGG